MRVLANPMLFPLFLVKTTRLGATHIPLSSKLSEYMTPNNVPSKWQISNLDVRNY